MSRIPMLDQFPEKSQELLSRYKKVEDIPHMHRVLAHAPAVLEAQMGFSKAMSQNSLPRQLRERVALFAAQSNGCAYCLAAHVEGAQTIGISDEEILAARRGHSSEPKWEAALRFVDAVLHLHGKVSDRDVELVKEAGFDDAQILELTMLTIQNIMTNYLNIVAQTEPDSPPVDLRLPVVATAFDEED